MSQSGRSVEVANVGFVVLQSQNLVSADWQLWRNVTGWFGSVFAGRLPINLRIINTADPLIHEYGFAPRRLECVKLQIKILFIGGNSSIAYFSISYEA